MKRKAMPVVGLLVRSGPYRQRSARSQLDVALVAAALDVPLRLYFLADAALQLADARDTRPAGLPAGYRGWASLASATRVTVFAERSWLERMAELGMEPLLKVQARTRAQMRTDWEKCARLLVL
jgi:DsrE/DsrF-like family